MSVRPLSFSMAFILLGGTTLSIALPMAHIVSHTAATKSAKMELDACVVDQFRNNGFTVLKSHSSGKNFLTLAHNSNVGSVFVKTAYDTEPQITVSASALVSSPDFQSLIRDLRTHCPKLSP